MHLQHSLRRLGRIGCALLFVGMLGAAAAPVCAQTTTAQLIFPADGAQNVDARLPFRWNAVVAAQAYRLQIGSQPPTPDPETGGATSVLTADVFDNGSIGATSVTVTPVPPNQTLYARLWTLISGNATWTYVDSTFQALPRPAAFTYPLDGDQVVDTRQPFTWNSVTGAQSYYLKIGTTPGASELLNTGELPSTITAYTVPRLPVGQTLYARLWTKANDTLVLYSDVSFQAMDRPATFLAPVDGAQFVDQRQPFAWTPVATAQAYELKIGTTADGLDLLDSGELPATQTSLTLPVTLPAHQTLYASISTKLNDTWFDSTISFQALPYPAQFTYPVNGSQFVDTRQPFTWVGTAGAEGYYVKVGTSPGGEDVLKSGELDASVTSLLMPSLPVGTTLYAALWTKGNGAWLLHCDISFVAVARPATFINPQNGATAVDQRLPITWTAIDGAQGYSVRIGDTPGGRNLVDTGGLTAQTTSYNLRNELPANVPLYARLSTRLNDHWWSEDITFQVVPRPATFVTPLDHAVNVDTRLPVQWTSIASAQAYVLTIGTSPGTKDLIDSGELAAGTTAYQLAAGLPPNQTVYARIATKFNNLWLYSDISFQAVARPATFIYPQDGDLYFDQRQLVTWTPIAGATGYYFKLGTTPGTQDLVNSGVLGAGVTSYRVNVTLPVEQTIYARISTQLNGRWWSVDTTIRVPRPASFTYPTDAAQNVDTRLPFIWTTANGAQAYALTIGTTRGAQDVFNSGEIAPPTVSYLLPQGLPTNRTLYARIATKLANAWWYNDISFSAVARPAMFVAPIDGARNVNPRLPVQWTGVADATAYRLTIGTSAGALDLVDSGELPAQTLSYTLSQDLPVGQTLYARIATKLNNLWWFSDISFTAAPRAAVMTYPQDGMQNVDTRLPFTWTAVTGAQSYYLKIGTTLGGVDVLETGGLSAQTTSFALKKPLPTNVTLYARISTRISDRWWYNDISFQAVGRPATFLAPTNGIINFDTRLPIRWTAAPGAQGYALTIGTTAGGQDLVNSGELATTVTSYLISTELPANQTLYARIATRLNNVWWYSDITFQAVTRPAALTYPLQGDNAVDTRLPFTWNAVAGSTGYYLKIGTTLGAQDLVNSRALSATVTSFKVKVALPVQQTLYARLSTQLNGKWWYNDITFKVPRPAIFTAPLEGAINVDTRQPFTWAAAAPTPQAYVLTIGTTLGGQDTFASAELPAQSTSFTLPQELPANRKLYARIATRFNNTWFTNDVSFNAVARPAVFTYPLQGATKVDTRVPFAWTAATGAQAYRLTIGTSAGGQDLQDSGELAAQVTSYNLPQELPVGSTVYARIATKLNDLWWYSDITFKAIPRYAYFTYPLDGTQHANIAQPITWSPIAGAQAYYLRVGTTLGGREILNSGTLSSQTTSFTVWQTVPTGQTIYARISTQLNGVWWSSDIAFSIGTPATFVYPRNMALRVDNSIPFRWTEIAGAVAYILTVGTTRGANNLFNGGETTATSMQVPTLPTATPLWARIATKFPSGELSYSDVTFTVQTVPVTFTSPVQGATDVPLTPVISWTAAATVNGIAPIYRLGIGTAPGVNNVLNLGNSMDTSYTVTTNLPAGQVLYARLNVVLGDNTRFYTDATFSTTGVTPALSLLYPAESDVLAATLANPVAVDASRPFGWNPLDLAAGYELQIYNGVGAADENGQPGIGDLTLARDSGVLHVPRVFFSDLPLGVYTARLGFLLQGTWRWRTFAFTVTHTGLDNTQQLQAASWATNYVRSMADITNNPYTWSLLIKYMANWPNASCLDYRETLIPILNEMRVGSGLPVDQQPRRLNIAFDVYDVHALAETYNTSTGKWVILDPTFALAITRTSDGEYATKEEVQQATLNQQWGDITYTPLGSFGTTIAHNYYLDYPLLYVNLGVPARNTGNHVLAYLQNVALPASGHALYAIQGTSPVSIVVNGQTQTMETLSADSVSQLFFADTLAVPAGSTATLQAYKPNRYVF